jgi:hypothetical protein
MPSLKSTRRKCILQFSSRVLRLPHEHPSSKAWLQDLLTVTPKSQLTFYCRSFVSNHEVMSLTHSNLPTHNSQLVADVMSRDTSEFLSARYGSSLRDCRRNYDSHAPYLFSSPILYARILARLRLDVAPINYSLHLRKLAPSPNCECDNLTHETRSHVLLECPFYLLARAHLVTKLPTVNDLNLAYVLDASTPATTQFILEVHRIRHLLGTRRGGL